MLSCRVGRKNHQAVCVSHWRYPRQDYWWHSPYRISTTGHRKNERCSAAISLSEGQDVQADWRWQKLKVTLDPTGRMTAAYGKQRQSHTFTKANKTGACRHIEILATMAVHGAWQPSRTHSEANKKAFKRLQAELQAILPLLGDPFRKEVAQFYPLFDLSLPKEHWRDSNDGIELGSEEV